VHEHAIRRGDRAAAVLVGGRLLGVVSATDAGRVPRERWPVTPVSVAMTTGELATVGPTTDLARALARMGQRGVNQLLVVRDGAVAGMLDREAIVRYVALGRPEQPESTKELEEART
jgi:CBS domain-containing protein